MNNWIFLDSPNVTGVSLAEARLEMTQFVERNIVSGDDGVPDPREGYSVLVWGAQTPSDYTTSRTATVSLRVGSSWCNEAHFEIGGVDRLPDIDLVTYSTYAGALKALVSNWACPWAFANVFVNDRPPIVQGVSYPTDDLPPFENAWIAYLSAPLAAGLSPPSEIVCQPTPGGGLILSAVLERLDPADPEHKRRSELLRMIMVERVGTPQVYLAARAGDY
jgi:hypothetical protein